MRRTPLHPAILGITPFHRPDPRLAIAMCRAGALCALDLGRDAKAASAALRSVAEATVTGLGVRVHPGYEPRPEDLPDSIEFVIAEACGDLARWRSRRVFARAVSLAEADRAVAAGAEAFLAAGHEGGGRVGEESTFVLLQRLLSKIDAPVWAHGGIGLHTAAACAVGGAAGVVIDGQLALVRESTLPDEIKRAIAAMDGTETTLLAGRRVFTRPDLPRIEELRNADSASVDRALGGDDLRGRLVPVGQDAAFARSLAESHATAGGVVQALTRGTLAHVAAARECRPLAPGAPLAADHGTEYPVLQGPMTRVSDRAAFAESVAAAGGLPFLALSLMRGDALHELLDETAARLGDRPWGVGVLGFVPVELRAEQLEAIASRRPPFALIAGGRPSQARRLEEQGIPTYLHVPSRGLLDMFLKDGARRFVFEGRECGGHVGPLSSFVLWQSQIDRLLAFDRLSEVSVVFAGGIQDARSAAMVAAMAAPLAARGARIGVLMGTAYLFTREAVATGAIVPAYQQAAIDCAGTILLETAPGHATRCAESAYTRGFRAERERLEKSGAEPKEVWARLEHMNLGRLRMASKGLKRVGDELVAMDEDQQKSEGMYMIGQVAALRDEECSMEELHREVTEGATEWLESVEVETQRETAARRPSDMAIVGMACVFPGASDLDAYWSNIVRGVNAIREVSPERWDPDVYYDPQGKAGQTTPSKWGGFLDPVPFEPTKYGIPPRSLPSIDPAQLLSLEVARRALEDAGYGRREFDRERTAVVFGTEGGSDLSHAYGFRALYPRYAGAIPPELDAVLPVATEDTFPGVLANVISGRIANRLDLGGENYTVNAACASSLASVSVGIHWLESRACDMVLAGGADLHCGIGDFLMFSSVHALSPGGQCRTFDQSADGISIGEGVGVVALKRLADAERDGDRIYAVIKGVAGSSDGKSLGLTAPRLEGQIRALERAWDLAGVPRESVGLMEAHGTGTVVGDRTELQSMEHVFGGRGIESGACVLGSIKSSIGHSKAAAGVASLIKVALCLHHGVRPPTLNLQRPNPYWNPETSPFSFRDRSHPWIGHSRVAGISAFGFGGTNYHAVVASHDGGEVPESGLTEWPEELFLVRGSDLAGARARAERLLALAEAEWPWALRELARAASLGCEPVRWAIVARSHEDLAAELRRALAGEADGQSIFAREPSADSPGKVAFLFAGQGSQHVDMLADLYVAFPDVRGELEANPEIAARMFPPRAFTPRDRAVQEAALTRTDVAQVALGLADTAMARALERAGLVPDMLAGHSYGELVALGEAGAWDAADVARLSRARGRAILEAAGVDPGAMAAVNAEPQSIEPLIEGMEGVVVANRNAPDQTVLSGRTAAVEKAVARLEGAGIKATRINVACAFHSPVVAGATVDFEAALRAGEVRPLRREVWSNITAAPYPGDPESTIRLLTDQIARPVRFVEQIEAMYEAGARVFVEVGPGRIQTRLVERILGDRRHVAVPTSVKGEGALEWLVRALARLAAAGVEFDPRGLFAGRTSATFDLDGAEARKLSPTAWLVDGQWARPASGPVPPGSFRPVTEPPVRTSANGNVPAAAPADDREAAMVEYLRSVREAIEAQREVMLRYLGAPTAAAEALPAPAGGNGATAADAAAVSVAATPRASAQPAPVAATPAPMAPEPAARGALSDSLLAIVSERTGYPVEMLDLDLDLEADLSIDSIKRIEILGALNEQTGLAEKLGDQRDELLEELAGIKTLRGIVAWIEERSPQAAVPVASTAAPSALAAGVAEASSGASYSPAPLAESLLAIVSERTGYPVEMLDLDLDLEADLSIDSIKRIEILGALNEQTGLAEKLGDQRDELLEELAGIKTLRGIVAWIEERWTTNGAVHVGERNGTVPAMNGSAASPAPNGSAAGLRRFRFEVRSAPPAARNGTRLDGRVFAIIDDSLGVAHALSDLLGSLGARATILSGEGEFDGIDGLVDLSRLSPTGGPEEVKRLFRLAKRALDGDARWIVAATGMGGEFGYGRNGSGRPGQGGVAGFLRSLSKERPEVHVRAIDLDPQADPRRLAEQLVQEILSTGGPVEVGYFGDERRELAIVPAPLERNGGGAAGLDEKSVVLVTGGARGIAAHVSIELARRHGCALELVGRSPVPEGDEPAEIAGIDDRRELKRRLIGLAPGARPAEIERRVREILAGREIRATLAEIAAAGGRARYHSVDVRSQAAFGALIDEIRALHGRIDAVLHAAGLIEDKLVVHKTAESFERVFDTKVVGALTLVEKLREDTRLIVFFSSAAAVFGNAGQTDYAAANDVLDRLAIHLAESRPVRAISVAWGPWDSAGMVSEELRREYDRRGIGLIPLRAGVAGLLDEIDEPHADAARIVLMGPADVRFADSPAPDRGY